MRGRVSSGHDREISVEATAPSGTIARQAKKSTAAGSAAIDRDGFSEGSASSLRSSS
jgi:hypothetical protein